MRDHRLSSLGKPRDAKRWSLRWNFLSHPHTHDRFLYSIGAMGWSMIFDCGISYSHSLVVFLSLSLFFVPMLFACLNILKYYHILIQEHMECGDSVITCYTCKRSKGRWFETHWIHCNVSLSKTLILCLVFVQHRKTGNNPDMTEKIVHFYVKHQHKQTNKTR